MFMVRRGERDGRWIAALRCADAGTADVVFSRWCERYAHAVVELLHGQAVVRQHFPPLPADAAGGSHATSDAADRHPYPQ